MYRLLLNFIFFIGAITIPSLCGSAAVFLYLFSQRLLNIAFVLEVDNGYNGLLVSIFVFTVTFIAALFYFLRFCATMMKKINQL